MIIPIILLPILLLNLDAMLLWIYRNTHWLD